MSAASSASGVSSIVSSEEIEGDRERKEVGVDGILEADEKEYPGYGSFAICAANEGEVLRELLGLRDFAWRAGEPALWYRGLVGRRLERGKVFV